MPRYKPGDSVIIREDLNDHTHYKMDPPEGIGWVAIRSMVKMRGQLVTISQYLDNDRVIGNGGKAYKVVEVDGVVWTDDMFSGLAIDPVEMDISSEDIICLL